MVIDYAFLFFYGSGGERPEAPPGKGWLRAAPYAGGGEFIPAGIFLCFLEFVRIFMILLRFAVFS